MPTTIEVNKQSVEALLGSGKSKPFVIPEYQRPYAWTDEQVETLFEDLWDFTATSGGTERPLPHGDMLEAGVRKLLLEITQWRLMKQLTRWEPVRSQSSRKENMEKSFPVLFTASRQRKTSYPRRARCL